MNILEEKEWGTKSVSHKSLYYLRSYKAVSILSSKRNLKYLVTVNEKSFHIISFYKFLSFFIIF